MFRDSKYSCGITRSYCSVTTGIKSRSRALAAALIAYKKGLIGGKGKKGDEAPEVEVIDNE